MAVTAGFHGYSNTLALKFAVETFSFAAVMRQTQFLVLTRLIVQHGNLLKCRVEIRAYNDHVGFSSRALVFSDSNGTRVEEPISS